MNPKDERDATPEAWSFAENRARQLVRGLALTPSQRLRWLEEMVGTWRRLQQRRERDQR